MSVDVLSLLRPVGYLHGGLPCHHMLSRELLTWFPVPVFHFAMKSLKGFFLNAPDKATPRKGPPAVLSASPAEAMSSREPRCLNVPRKERGGTYPGGRREISKAMKTSP